LLTAWSVLPAAAMLFEAENLLNTGRGAYDTTGLPKPQPPIVEEHMKIEADAIDTPQTLNSPSNIEKGGLQA